MRSRPSALRDFTVDRRTWFLSAVSIVIGAGGAALAVLLLRAIALSTNIFFYRRISLAMVGPAGSNEPHAAVLIVPVIGGIIVGLIARYGSDKILGHGIPEAIEADLLRGNAPVALLLGLVIAKSLMWAFSLSSGTSGGVLAPLLMIGAAIGESAAHLAHLPGSTQALWALLAMGAMLAGALGVPLTAVLFSLELTHALPAILPLLLACTASYLVTSLIMPRSILTEKLSRRGYHLSREYGVDPLELVTAAEVMTELPPGDEVKIGKQDHLPEAYVFSDETCRAVAEEMATTGLLNLLVVDRETNSLLGSVGAAELLAGRRRAVKRESERTVAFQLETPRA